MHRRGEHNIQIIYPKHKVQKQRTITKKQIGKEISGEVNGGLCDGKKHTKEYRREEHKTIITYQAAIYTEIEMINKEHKR